MGTNGWRIQKLANRLGIANRVVYLQGGDLGRLIRGSIGMVTVNSTSGVHALQLGSPVKVLGAAVYDIAGLTYQDGLDTFWRSALPPDQDLVNAFIKAMASSIQIRGVYFSEPGLSVAVHEATKRLYSGTVGESYRL